VRFARVFVIINKDDKFIQNKNEMVVDLFIFSFNQQCYNAVRDFTNKITI